MIKSEEECDPSDSTIQESSDAWMHMNVIKIDPDSPELPTLSINRNQSISIFGHDIGEESPKLPDQNSNSWEKNEIPSLLEFLNETPNGRSIITCHKLNKTLTTSKRNTLTRLVLEREHRNKPQYTSISSARYKELANEICTLFPSEVPASYYVPHKKTSAGTIQISQGKLLNHNNYLIRKQLNENPKRKRQSENADETDDESKPTEENLNDLEFLKQNIEPWEKIELLWIATFKERQKLLQSSSIEDYYKLFPCLKQKNGYCLLEFDFNIKFPEKKDAFQTNWPAVRNQLIKIFQGPHKPSNPIFLEEAAKLRYLSGDALDFALFLLLSNEFPKPTCITKNVLRTRTTKSKNIKLSDHVDQKTVKKWNPTRAESRSGFIFHIEKEDDILENIESLKKKLLSYELSFQPRPIVTGKIDESISAHVYVDNTQYDLISSARAVEVSFKMFFALNIHYPPEARAAWLFVQRAIFQLVLTDDPSLPSAVSSLIGELSINFN